MLQVPQLGNFNKKYQCFVCGEIIDSYPLFKQHIIDNHELGREYLLCPCRECQSPVRDLRIHFKSKHPGLKLPSNVQFRCAVWRVFSDDGKKSKTLPCFKDGNYLSEKNGGKLLHYRSSYELEVYQCLEKMSDVNSYRVEPFGIEYFFKGKKKTYYPDLLVHYLDCKASEIWEIKPKRQKSLEQNQCKWDSCKNICLARGWGFEVYDEPRIKLLKERVNNI